MPKSNKGTGAVLPQASLRWEHLYQEASVCRERPESDQIARRGNGRPRPGERGRYPAEYVEESTDRNQRPGWIRCRKRVKSDLPGTALRSDEAPGHSSAAAEWR